MSTRLALLIVALAVGLFAAPSVASAQIWNIETAILEWDWAQGDGGVVEEFRIKCGAQTYVITDPSARSVSVKDVVPTPGSYTCTISAANQTAESAVSAPLSFQTGSPPSPPVTPVNLRIGDK